MLRLFSENKIINYSKAFSKFKEEIMFKAFLKIRILIIQRSQVKINSTTNDQKQ